MVFGPFLFSASNPAQMPAKFDQFQIQTKHVLAANRKAR